MEQSLQFNIPVTPLTLTEIFRNAMIGIESRKKHYGKAGERLPIDDMFEQTVLAYQEAGLIDA